VFGVAAGFGQYCADATLAVIAQNTRTIHLFPQELTLKASGCNY
jgi:hypothetical protein